MVKRLSERVAVNASIMVDSLRDLNILTNLEWARLKIKISKRIVDAKKSIKRRTRRNR